MSIEITPEMRVALSKAASDRYLQQNSDLKRYAYTYARNYELTTPAYVLDQKRADNGVITSMVDRVVKKARDHMMAGEGFTRPTGRYLSMDKLPADHLAQLLSGKMTYEWLVNRCEVEYDDEHVKTRTAIGLVASHPDHFWVCRGYSDFARLHEMLSANVLGVQQKFAGPGCDWPLSPACDGRLAPAVFVVPFARPSDFLVFCNICKFCWSKFVQKNQISATLGTGLVPG